MFQSANQITFCNYLDLRVLDILIVPHESGCNWSPLPWVARTGHCNDGHTQRPQRPQGRRGRDVAIETSGREDQPEISVGNPWCLRDFYGFLRCFLGISGVFKLKQEKKQLANTPHSVVLF